jgi:hypothetical protein
LRDVGSWEKELVTDNPYEGLNPAPPEKGFELWRHRNAGRPGTDSWSGLYLARR